MKYRMLGKTGLQVSALGFGASSLGSVFRNIDDREGIRAVHAALDAGINYIDVAPYYGEGKAENVLGEAIRSVPRDKYLLSTKAGRYGRDNFDFRAERIVSSVEESLARLHTDYLDILFLHDVEFVPANIIVEEAMHALDRLKLQGKIRFGGISGLPLTMFRRLIPRMEIDAVLSYCHYTLNDSTLLELCPLLEEKEVGLVNASPFAMGLLSPHGAPAWHPADPGVKSVCSDVAAFCASIGVDIAKLAIQYSTSNERIPTTLVSTADAMEITNNARWLNEPIDEEALQTVLERLSPIRDMTWASGLSEYNEHIRTVGR